MTSLEHRMQLMGQYGLRMPWQELFGFEECGRTTAYRKVKVNRAKNSYRRPKCGARPPVDEQRVLGHISRVEQEEVKIDRYDYTKKFMAEVGGEALKAVNRRGWRSTHSALNVVAGKYGVAVTTVKRWMERAKLSGG